MHTFVINAYNFISVLLLIEESPSPYVVVSGCSVRPNMSFNDDSAAAMNPVDCAIPAAGAASPGISATIADLGIFESNDR